MSQKQPPVRPLVIGVGNRDRGDDAAGPLVADAVGQRFGSEIDHLVMEGDLCDLALRWSDDQTVVIVDAMVSGRPPGAIVEFDGLATQLPAQSGLISSHGIGLGESLELARLLDRLPAALTIVAIEAATLEHHAPQTPAVSEAVKNVVSRIPAIVDGARGLSTEHDGGRLNRNVDN